MKKTLVTLVVMALGLSMTAAALPPITFDAGCAATTQLSLAWELWDVVLLSLDVNELDPAIGTEDDPVDTALIDMEYAGGDLETGLEFGDGIPDLTELTLLSQAMCADATVAADVAANATAMQDQLLTPMGNLVTWATGAGAPLTTLATDIATFAATLPDSQPYATYKAQLNQLAGYVGLIVSDLLPAITATDGGVAQYATVLTQMKPAIAAQASLSSEQIAILNLLMTLLVGLIDEPVEGVGLTPAQIVDMVADNCTGAAGLLAGLAPQALVDEMNAGATLLHEASTITGGTASGIFATIEPPTFAPAGVAKLANEPFSGAGDYDGDGVTNLVTYNAIVANGGNTADFVGAVTGANPFYTGNPLLPAVGIVGLAALISAMTAGGAFVLRKK